MVVEDGPDAPSRVGPPPARRSRRAGAIALLLALSGCGYSLTAGDARMPREAQRVFVRPFENRTTDAEAGALVAAALRQELARRGAEGGTATSARIEGTVEDASYALVVPNPPTYGLSLTVSARLLVGDELVAERRTARSEQWLSGFDPLENEGWRRVALRRAAEAVAKDLLETFQEP
jgi:hypothetical protein